MTALIRRYLSLSSSTGDKQTCTERALPSLWYRSGHLYELERRAIFSKRWMLVSHKLRFVNIGDWVRFEEAGFEFFLCLNKEGNINGFHNVCRHRGFPIVTEATGRSQIFSCKYHGWSYGLGGKLAKAPGYQEMTGFDKTINGLLQVHVYVDRNNFIWVNLDSSEEPEVAWSDEFQDVDIQPRFENYEFANYHFDHTWNMIGDYNWKTLADNYNECYHCPTAHPDAADLADLKMYSVETSGGYIKHFANTSKQNVQQGLKIASTFYFPNACMTVSPHFFYMMRCVPKSAHQCSMEYEVYRHNEATDAEFEKIDTMFKRILKEDKWLCNSAQKNLNAGVFINGEMHSRMEKGPLFFQSTVRALLKDHRKLEESRKQEIWPARQALPAAEMPSREDLDFCASLDCDQAQIAW
ncbi:hypothetical protein LTR05_008787 [Lithohypha guttulata]|uniref:Choline monooxygenase, chloroplastic n=1 Tax=Lithohypha guttulata TaxID=1690604 RepID=A0AAN7SL88_9EURO|nr:hypothetical protein LTR05_008787 [Lithohypha guttulata]